MPEPLALPIPPDRAAELVACAATLRSVECAAISTIESVRPFHRPDVWRGAVADRFGTELDDARRLVAAACERLREAARRIDAQVTNGA